MVDVDDFKTDKSYWIFLVGFLFIIVSGTIFLITNYLQYLSKPVSNNFNSPLSTPVPTPTPTPLPAFDTQKYVNTRNLNIREQPLLSSKAIVQLPLNTTVQVSNKTITDPSGYPWALIKTAEGKIGWAVSYFKW